VVVSTVDLTCSLEYGFHSRFLDQLLKRAGPPFGWAVLSRPFRGPASGGQVTVIMLLCDHKIETNDK
jgi:hypothetical protein